MQPFVREMRSSWLAYSSLACLLLVVSGCGGDGIERVSVTGNVTLDGKPLEEGIILFSPQGPGPSASANVVQGKYEVPVEVGPSPGDYKVEVRAYRSTGKQIKDEASGLVEEQKVSIIPPRYNHQTTLTAKFTAEGPNQFDFDLKSK